MLSRRSSDQSAQRVSRGGSVVAVLAVGLLAGCPSGEPPGASADRSGTRASASERADSSTFILISLDGFRWDYPELHGAPTLQRLAHNGVRADGLIPIFPSKTFPSHYTLVTGLYAENHGIVGNNMWDPQWDARFSLGRRAEVENPRWWEGEPIWVTAEKQGRTAAAYFWPGSEAPIQGVRPSYWKRYDDSIPGEQRVDEVLAWLDLPESERPSLITLYFSEVDDAGHRYGPEAAETRVATKQVDGYLAQLVAGLEARGILDRVDLVVVSDHGMAAMDPERVIVLEDYIDVDDVRIVDISCIAMMHPKEGLLDQIHEALAGAHPNLHVYRRDAVSEALHYRDHRRITPIVSWTDPGWYIYATHQQRDAGRSSFSRGMHGFDPRERDMHGLLVASGPSFRRGLEVPALENVHIYELMTAALGLEPAVNDGDRSRIEALLAKRGE